MTRRNNLGRLVAGDQAISREQALAAYTVGGTWLTREEHLKGTLALGKLADLIVIDRDYFTVPEDEIKDIRVEMTMVGGTMVYAQNPQAWSALADPAT